MNNVDIQQSLIDNIEVDACLETSFALLEYYQKKLDMETYMEYSIDDGSELYQEGLKEAWESDTSAFEGKSDEGTFAKIVKFLPRLIRNIAKWIVNHVKKLFGKDDKNNKKKIDEHEPSEQAEQEFERNLDSDETGPVQMPELLRAAYANLRKHVSELNSSLKTQGGAKPNYVDAKTLYTNIYVNKNALSVFNIKSVQTNVDEIQKKSTDMGNIVNAIGKRVSKLTYNDAFNKVDNAIASANGGNAKFFIEHKKRIDDMLNSLTSEKNMFFYSSKGYDAFMQKYSTDLQQLSNNLTEMANKLDAVFTGGSAYGKKITTSVQTKSSEYELNNIVPIIIKLFEDPKKHQYLGKVKSSTSPGSTPAESMYYNINQLFSLFGVDYNTLTTNIVAKNTKANNIKAKVLCRNIIDSARSASDQDSLANMITKSLNKYIRSEKDMYGNPNTGSLFNDKEDAQLKILRDVSDCLKKSQRYISAVFAKIADNKKILKDLALICEQLDSASKTSIGGKHQINQQRGVKANQPTAYDDLFKLRS